MKSVAFLLAILAITSALVVPETAQADAKLDPRADEEQQELTNPDEEDQFTVDDSQNRVDKSKILSGIGPEAAAQRFFDWDQTCTDAAYRDTIVRAFNAFQPLVTSASARLLELKNGLPVQGKKSIKNSRYIIQVDPAYTQMFKYREDQIDYVKESFDLITNNVNTLPRQNFNGPSSLRFICDPDGKVMKNSGETVCGEGPGAAQAVTFVPQDPDDNRYIEPKYRFTKSSSIVFCPAFFDDTKFPSLESLIANTDAATLTLDQVDCRERVLIHEYMHLQWVRNMNPPDGQDYTGYFNAADAGNKLIFGQAKITPDLYAWYALYSYFNNFNGACARDAWPPKGPKKPVKTNI